MPSLTSELFVRLLDGVTKPAAGIARALRGIKGAQDSVNAQPPLGQRLANASVAAGQQVDNMRGRMLDAVAAGYLLKQALTAPLNAAADFETVLEDMGQKAGIPRAALGALGEDIKQVARDTNQATMDIASAVDQLLGMGAAQDVALAAAAPIGQAATAYRAATQDLANASWAAVDNLKVPADQIGTAIDAMAAAGKEGAFELRDMAQYFPGLGAQYQALGQSGTDAVADIAAALQVVRKGTGDASSAATNLQNVLQKIYAPGTIAAFKKEGVDVFAEMAAAAERGLTPIEAIAELTEKTLNGDLSKMGTLFQDAQVQAGMRSLIQGMDEYRRIRDVAMNSEGTVSEDYLRRIQTAQGAQDRWNASTQNLAITFGTTLVPVLNQTLDTLIPVIGAIGDFAAANPELASGLLTATAALIGLRVAMVGMKYAAALAKSGVIDTALAVTNLGGGVKNTAKFLASPFRSFGTHVAGITQIAAMRFSMMNREIKAGQLGLAGAVQGTFATMGRAAVGLVNPLGMVSGAFRVLKIALISTGVGAIAVALAAAGIAIYENWDGLGKMFNAFGAAFVEAMGPVMPAIQPLIDGVSNLLGWVKGLLGPIDESGAAWTSWGTTAGTAVGTAVAGMILKLQEVMTFITGIPASLAAIDWSGMATAAINAFKSIPAGLSTLGTEIAAIFTTIDYVGIGTKIISDLWAGIQAAIGGLAEFVRGQIASMFTLPTIRMPWDNSPAPAAPGAPAAPAASPAPAGATPPLMAKGGPLRRGESAIVGDGGEEELFTAGADGYITPASELMPRPSTATSTGAPKGDVTFAPVWQQNAPIYGVADLQAEFDKFAARMKGDFDSIMAGQFSDA